MTSSPLSKLRSARVRAALSLGVVLAVGASGTFAYFTDSVAISGTTISSGSIDLKVNNSDGPITGYANLTLANMVPGNSVAAVFTVKNTGASPLKYTATTTATNADSKDLRSAVTVKVTGDASTGGSGSALTCPGSALSGTGTTLNGSLITTGRQLAATTGQETICVQITLPSAATGPQGATSDVGITFSGTSDLS